jgi:hypothetical protein
MTPYGCNMLGYDIIKHSRILRRYAVTEFRIMRLTGCVITDNTNIQKENPYDLLLIFGNMKFC